MSALEIVQKYYEAFNQQDWKTMLSLVDNQIKHEPNQGTPRIGSDLFKDFLQMMDDAYEEHLTEMVFYTDASQSKIACEFVVNGIYKKGEEGFPPAHGQKYVLPAAAFVEVNGDKIVRVATHYNLEKWVELVS